MWVGHRLLPVIAPPALDAPVRGTRKSPPIWRFSVAGFSKRATNGGSLTNTSTQPVPSVEPDLSPSPETTVDSAVDRPPTRGWRAVRRSFRPKTTAFWGMHVIAVVGAIAYFSWWGVALAIVSYFVRMVLVTAAYHRYFSH